MKEHRYFHDVRHSAELTGNSGLALPQLVDNGATVSGLALKLWLTAVNTRRAVSENLRIAACSSHGEKDVPDVSQLGDPPRFSYNGIHSGGTRTRGLWPSM